MKKILFLLFVISFIGCDKDENKEIDEIDYSYFLALRTPSVRGSFNNEVINWQYGWGKFQMGSGYGIGNGVCSETNPVRILQFYLTNSGGTEQFVFVTPPMDTSDQTEVNTVLNNGEKQVGEIYEDFYISYRKNGQFYKSNSNTADKLEILKTEEFLDIDNSTRILIWIKIEHLILENNDQNNENIELKNVSLIAELFGHRFK